MASPKVTALPTTPAPPILPCSLQPMPLREALGEALTSQSDVEGKHFTDDAFTDSHIDVLEFSGCLFERCTFTVLPFKRLFFVDCCFSHCDFSGAKLENTTFQRVLWQESRLTGCDFIKASLSNVSFLSCTADLIGFADTKLTKVAFTQCRLRESLWQNIRHKDVIMDACDLTSAQISDMPMAGMNMTTCVLEGIKIGLPDLRGMAVTALQGVQLCRLFGLKIIE